MKPYGDDTTDLTARHGDVHPSPRNKRLRACFFFALLALGALVAAGWNRIGLELWRALLPMAGAWTYLLGSFLVVPAADARYNFWANLVFMVTFC